MSFRLPTGAPIVLASASTIDRNWVPTSKPSPERVIDCTVIDPATVDPTFFASYVSQYRSEKLADGTIRLHFPDSATADTAHKAVSSWLRGMGKADAVHLALACPTTSLVKAADVCRGATYGSFTDLHVLASATGWVATLEHDETGATVRVVLTRG